jgi:hypothetical protein
MVPEDDGRPLKYVGVDWYHMHVFVCASCWSYKWIISYCSVWISLRKLFRFQVAARFITVRKVHHRTGHEGPEWDMTYSSSLSLTLALDGGGWSAPRPGCFVPRKETRYPLHRRLGGPQGDQDRCRKSRLHRDSISWPSNPWRVAIPSTLSQPTIIPRGWRKFQRSKRVSFC